MGGTANKAKLKESAQVFTHSSTHNAYHIGQIIYVRKKQRSWDPKNGVPWHLSALLSPE